VAGGFGYLLLLDVDARPLGWIGQDRIPTFGELTESMAVPMSPLLNQRATLKDALSLLLDADVQAGIVVDGHGKAVGLVTVEMIAEVMRQGDHVVPETVHPADDDGTEAGLPEPAASA
jgi:hypothetical protein